MNSSARFFAVLFGVLAIVLFDWAAVDYFSAPLAKRAYVRESDLVLSNCSFGRENKVRIPIVNPTSHIVRIIGLGEC